MRLFVKAGNQKSTQSAFKISYPGPEFANATEAIIGDVEDAEQTQQNKTQQNTAQQSDLRWPTDVNDLSTLGGEPVKLFGKFFGPSRIGGIAPYEDKYAVNTYVDLLFERTHTTDKFWTT